MAGAVTWVSNRSTKISKILNFSIFILVFLSMHKANFPQYFMTIKSCNLTLSSKSIITLWAERRFLFRDRLSKRCSRNNEDQQLINHQQRRLIFVTWMCVSISLNQSARMIQCNYCGNTLLSFTLKLSRSIFLHHHQAFTCVFLTLNSDGCWWCWCCRYCCIWT